MRPERLRKSQYLKVLVVVAVSGVLVLAALASSAGAKPTVSPKQQAAAAVAAAAAPVKFTSPGGAINVQSLAGKKIWIITLVTGLPFIQAVYAGAQDAAAKAGVSVTLYDSKGSTTNAATGVEQAIAAKAAAIVLFAVNVDFVKQAVADANKANIPVVGLLNVDSHSPVEPGAAGEVSIDYKKSGALVAAYAIANTNGPVHAAYQNFPGVATFASEKQGLTAAYKKYCPSGCSLSSDDLTATDFKTGVQTLTGAESGRIKGLNWIFVAFDGIAEFTVPSVQTIGKSGSIRVGSINAATANLQFIKSGKVQAVDVGNSNAWLGWAAVDRAMRASLGGKAGFTEVPIRLFDHANLAKVKNLKNEDALFNNVPFRADYAALWTH
jgi:ribose transport system substrate-binding protein